MLKKQQDNCLDQSKVFGDVEEGDMRVGSNN